MDSLFKDLAAKLEADNARQQERESTKRKAGATEKPPKDQMVRERDMRCYKKMAKMERLSKDADATLYDKHAMLVSACGLFTEHWPRKWEQPRQAAHVAYIKACHEAAYVILFEAASCEAVLAAWCAVPALPMPDCDTLVGTCALRLLRSITERRHFELALRGLAEKK